MKIIVRDGKNTNVNLRLPTGLPVNHFSAMFLPKVLKQNGVMITRAQAIQFVKALNKYRRHHKDWKLVEVQSSDGTYVEIKI